MIKVDNQLLSERKLRILRAVVDDYILTAIPVGSKAIAQRFDMQISSATIRNEMSDLEEMGFLQQPHTSAGRIPSDLAYRLYVDRFMQIPEFSGVDAEFLNSYFDRKVNEVEQVVRSATKMISDLTEYTSVMTPPVFSRMIIKHLQLVPVHEGKALMVIVSDTGLIKDVFVDVPVGMDSDLLYHISCMLNNALANTDISQSKQAIMGLMQDLQEHREFFQQLIKVFEEYSREKEVALGGVSNVLKYSDMEQAQSLISVLESKDTIYDLIADGSTMQYEIKIGKETGIEPLKDCSLVTVNYRVGDKDLGKIGVIGPTRMHYSKVLSILHYMGKSLSDIMTEIFTPNIKNKGE